MRLALQLEHAAGSETPRGTRGRGLGVVLAVVAIALATSSCATSERAAGGRRDAPRITDVTITELNMLAVPVALNLDQAPGADGFMVKIYAGNPARPKAIPIEKGTLEIVMYDGTLGATSATAAEPLRVWTFDARELQRLRVVTTIGIGYEIIPRWGDAKPTRDKFTVEARFLSPEGLRVRSARSVISLTK